MLATGGHIFDKLLVAVVDQGLEQIPLGIGQVAGGRKNIFVGAGLEGLRVNANGV